MTNHEAMNLASDCAQAMFKRDTATQAMDMRLLSVAPGCARVGMSVRADMIQGHGTCHGGYLFALADSAFAFACNSYNEATVAIGCSIDYIARRAWRHPECRLCRAKPLRSHRQLRRTH